MRKQSHCCSMWTIHRIKYIENNVKTSIKPVFLLGSNYIICSDLYYPPFYENCENRCTLSLSREQTANMTIPKMKRHFWNDTLSRALIRIKIPLSEWFNFLSNLDASRSLVQFSYERNILGKKIPSKLIFPVFWS